MAIEPIGSVDAVSPLAPADSPLVEYLRQVHASPVQIALAEAQAEAAETVEQRAADGDPIALLQVAREEAAHTPIQSQQLQTPHTEHHPGDHGVHEEGKGDAIDIYD